MNELINFLNKKNAIISKKNSDLNVSNFIAFFKIIIFRKHFSNSFLNTYQFCKCFLLLYTFLGSETFSAVSMLGGNSGYSFGESIKGVIRFVQTNEGCIIDGTIDGLSPGPHGLHIHECGDISKGCER